MTPDDKWMLRALALARKGEGRVHPNPMVGAVLVKNGRLISEGFHHAYGKPHAEVDAIRKAGPRARGATLYVTLEPCSHFGRTPPCSRAVIDAGIHKVVAAMTDPNPKVSGRGLKEIRRAGISIVRGTQESESRQLNRAFITWVTLRRPFVTLKAASSLDGKTATTTGESKWITGTRSRQAGHALRTEADAVAVGVQTILKDNPSLSAHGVGRDPLRIVFDSTLRTPLSAKILCEGSPVWIVTGENSSTARRKLLAKKGVTFVTAPVDRSGRIRLKNALELLAEKGVAHLLLEGGATLAASFLRDKIVDEISWFIAPIVLNDAKKLMDAVRLKSVQVERLENDVWIKGRVI